MNILLSGSNGLIGTALAQRLDELGHNVIPLVRDEPQDGEISWQQIDSEDPDVLLSGINAVIHLGGANIGAKRWNAEVKQNIYRSRIDTTTLLANALARMIRRPSVFICGSAIGYYGNRGEEILTEQSSRGAGFLADVVNDWEVACLPAANADIRVVHLRTGVVMSEHGGMLERLIPAFKTMMGGRLGTGQQWMSWVSLTDEVNAIVFALENHNIYGPINVCSPNPVRNTTFTKTLGSVMQRPTPVPIFPWMLKASFGTEMTNEMMLVSQRCEPEVLLSSGFQFEQPELAETLFEIAGEDR